MFFVSTRNSGVLCKFQDIVLNPVVKGHGGLFVPSFFTPMGYPEIERIATMSYPQSLAEIVYGFCDGCISKSDLTNLTNEAFKDFSTGFGTDNKQKTGDKYFSTLTLEEGLEIANLNYGPTGCCKDYGYCFAASLVNHFAKKEGKIRNIVDCSGGSSGPSVAWATRNKDFLRAFTLVKEGKNNSVKATLAKANENANNIGYAMVSCEDSFINDIRYEVYNNDSFAETMNLVFINDLNLVSVFAYLPAFFKAYIKCNSSPFSVFLPTGNASLAMAAFFAKKIGIPIRKIVLATEKNDFFNIIQDSKVAINNNNQEIGCSSLHSAVPTNFERIMFYLFESNQGSVKRAMEELESNMRYKISDKLVDKFEEDFFVAKCDNQFSIRNVIYSMIREREIYVEQHFAIAKLAIDQITSALGATITNSPMVIFNTLDFRRNLDFVNASLGYDIERPNLPWTPDDVKKFAPVEITADKNEVLRYIMNALENPEVLKTTNAQKEGEGTDDSKNQ